MTLIELLAQRQDPAIGAVHLLTVLESLPGARKVDTRRGLDAAGVAPRGPLGELSDEDLAVVVQRFGGGASGAAQTGPSEGDGRDG